jgi:23S rRNA (cytidine1920-2'-O)/16S rRNA (cytidine1409-2'-O)-methyltransferase
MSQKLSRKTRVDVLLVEQGLAETREKAQALVLAGQVCVGDRLLAKPGHKLPSDVMLRLKSGSKEARGQYVSRGSHKLLGALEYFRTELQGKTCLDIGASTGGFTQVCLEHGAAKVYALDVGTNQLHWSLRSDPRVVSLEQINVREIPAGTIPLVDFICIDTSFISLKLVLPQAKAFLKPGGEMIVLIKPQHEVGKENVGKGGIVSDPVLHERVTREITDFAQSIGLASKGLIESSLKGTTGNKEFLIYLVTETKPI